eukprot:44401-Hanusia_phi.AAC.2
MEFQREFYDLIAVEEDEAVVLCLYTVNDEIEGMQMHVARGQRDRRDACLSEGVCHVGRDGYGHDDDDDGVDDDGDDDAPCRSSVLLSV